jgi:hypothetical protein
LAATANVVTLKPLVSAPSSDRDSPGDGKRAIANGPKHDRHHDHVVRVWRGNRAWLVAWRPSRSHGRASSAAVLERSAQMGLR